MSQHRPRFRRRLGLALVPLVLAGLGATLLPAPHALADDTATASASSDTPADDAGGSTSTSETDATTTEPAAPEPAAPPTAMVALAAVHDAQVLLDRATPTGELPTLDPATVDRLRDDLTLVLRFFVNPVHGPEADTVDTGKIEVAVQEALRMVEDFEVRDVTGPLALDLDAVETRVREAAAGLLLVVSRDIVLPDVTPPSPREVQAMANRLAAALTAAGGQATADAQALLAELAAMVAYLADPQHAKPVAAAVTALLLTLGNIVNPLPAALAPSAETAFAASGELVSWSDELARQAAYSGNPFYENRDTDTDEPGETAELRPVDSDVVVADEPVVIPGPAYATAPVPPTAELDTSAVDATVSTASGVDCGMYPGETCAPPMQWHGGPVIHAPIVRVVLAGTWWRANLSAASGLDSLYSGMSGSAYQRILTQYYDGTGYVGGSVRYDGMHVVDGTPPPVVPRNQVGAYAAKASRSRAGWGTSDSVVWVVVLPPGSVGESLDEKGVSKTEDKCGYQAYMRSGDRNYVVAQLDYPRANCMYVKGDVRGSLTAIGGHEYVGAVTNPQLNGWYDGKRQHLPDLCRNRYVRGPGGEYVSQVWSNGDKRCVSSFTPRFSYRITGVREPDGDTGPNSPYTRGHAYSAAIINAVNTGNMAWLGAGAKATYLATSDNLCSPFTDRATSSGWASCRRVYMGSIIIEPGEPTAFSFSIRPDGTTVDGRSHDETFTLVAGTTWMTNTGSTVARFTDMRMHTFDAVNVAGTPVGYVAAGQQGTDVKVPITLRNTGTATWFPNEVLTIGTPPGTTSPYAASSWPKGPGGCRDCRAHRVNKLVPPGATYTFDLTLHLPADRKVGGVATFYPYADVQRVSDKGTTPKQLTAGRITVRVVVLPSPVGTHEVFGQGFADGGDPNAGTSGFSCVAVSNVDAVSTGVTSCSARVTTAGGEVLTGSAGGSSTAGAVAVVAGLVPYDPSAGDTIVVCWVVTSTFLDGTKDDDTGCTT